MTTELTKAAQQALEPCPLTRAIQRINSNPYSLTKDECVEVLRGLRDELPALTQRPAAQGEREANATARAFSLATMGAEEFVRCNGLPTGNSDEFLMTGPDLTDEHATACVDHLKWVGECVAFDTDDGVLVRLGDFTLGSLS